MAISRVDATTRVAERDGLRYRLLRTCAFEVKSGGASGASAQMNRPLFRIGSHADNDLVLDDPTVSKHHLLIEAVPEGYRVTDLGSSNGTFVLDLRIHEAVVVNPVTLRLGDCNLRMMPGTAETELPASTQERFGAVLGRSMVMRELFHTLERVASTESTVLLQGETGVGKELVAESLHAESPRASGPFVVVDCAALSGHLAESELFGHVRGAFTGADQDRQGLVPSANGGVLFLDEIGELPPTLQVKLLGALERRSVMRVGSNARTPLDLRIIAATRKNLAREVNRGSFRSDLYYRLAVVQVSIPPLRERREDIPLLVDHFLAALREQKASRVPETLSAIALAKLSAQSWPGNVRELRNAVERAVLALGEADNDANRELGFVELRRRVVEEFEDRYIEGLLQTSGHNVSEAARRAQMDRRNFQRLLRRRGHSLTGAEQ